MQSKRSFGVPSIMVWPVVNASTMGIPRLFRTWLRSTELASRRRLPSGVDASRFVSKRGTSRSGGLCPGDEHPVEERLDQGYVAEAEES